MARAQIHYYIIYNICIRNARILFSSTSRSVISKSVLIEQCEKIETEFSVQPVIRNNIKRVESRIIIFDSLQAFWDGYLKLYVISR